MVAQRLAGGQFSEKFAVKFRHIFAVNAVQQFAQAHNNVVVFNIIHAYGIYIIF